MAWLKNWVVKKMSNRKQEKNETKQKNTTKYAYLLQKKLTKLIISKVQPQEIWGIMNKFTFIRFITGRL